MKQILIYFSIISLCLSNDSLPKKLKKIKDSFQKRYNISSLEDIKKFQYPDRAFSSTSTRDMQDIVGEWYFLKQLLPSLEITVGSDQSLMNPGSISGMSEAEGSITATGENHTTELTYLLFPGNDDIGDEGCEPCDGADGCGSYYSEGDCLSNDGCDWYGASGPGCDDCEPCDGADGCGMYNSEGDCINQGCEWLGWQDGPGCGGDDYGLRTHDDELEFDYGSDMIYPRYGAAYVTDGQYIYAFCGAESDTLGDSTIFHEHGERYEPGTGSWTMFGENLIQRRYTVAEYASGNIYLFNGRTDTNAVEIINVETGNVTVHNSNPNPVTYGGSAVWNDKIYIFGGDDGPGYSNHLYEFNPQDTTWTRLADMPDSINTNGVVVDGVLYTFGGYNGDVSSDINAYYIELDTWETIGQMPTGVSAHSIATDGQLIYIIGDYSNIDFTGVYDPVEREFYDKTGNMEGRRHSSSIYLDHLYVYGGAQPPGYNGNNYYTTLSSMQVGNLIEDEDDEGVVVMNMTFFEFFMLMFGYPADSLGVNNPTAINISVDRDDDDVYVDFVEGVIFEDGEMIEIESDPTETPSLASFDTTNFSFTMNGLTLFDSTGTSSLSLSGSIGPSMWNFVAGVPMEIKLSDMYGAGYMYGGDDYYYYDDDREEEMFFYGDSTGMNIVTEFDYYYDDTIVDTVYFSWYADTDSLFIDFYEQDYYYESDTVQFEGGYEIYGDSLMIRFSQSGCIDYEDYYQDDECVELGEEIFQLEDIEEANMLGGIIFLSQTLADLDYSENTFPKEYKLHSNYPNPFNPVTTIRFDVGANPADLTTLKVYDISGRNVATLINDKLQVGRYEAMWDASGFASGVYFTELISGSFRKTRKMILLK